MVQHQPSPQEQEAKAQELKGILSSDVDAKLKAGGEEGLSRDTLSRWLRARKWDVKAAAKDLAAHAAWRQGYVPHGRIMEVGRPPA